MLTGLFSRRIDKILIAATKADHIHHEAHDRLQALVRRLADKAAARAGLSGAAVDVLALAAVRATREGTVNQGGDVLPVIIGTPIDLSRVMKITKPHQRVRYELQEIGQPTLQDVLMKKFGKKK